METRNSDFILNSLEWPNLESRKQTEPIKKKQDYKHMYLTFLVEIRVIPYRLVT